MAFIYLSLFGALGVITRHQIEQSLKSFSHFHLGVFSANTIGCLLAGLLYGYLSEKTQNKEMAQYLLIGYCGGLTTFSSYCLKILTSVENGEILKAILFTTISIIIGLLAIIIGMKITK